MTGKYSKEQLHEAFTVEYYARKRAQERFNREVKAHALTRRLAEPFIKLFGSNLTPEWEYSITHGITKIYHSTQILTYHFQGDICIVNSGSVNDTKFTKSILKDIRALIKKHKSIVISSSVESIAGFLNKYGFRYNTEIKAYERGIKWDYLQQ